MIATMEDLAEAIHAHTRLSRAEARVLAYLYVLGGNGWADGIERALDGEAAWALERLEEEKMVRRIGGYVRLTKYGRKIVEFAYHMTTRSSR